MSIQVHSSVNDSLLSPYVSTCVNWFDAYGAANKRCEWMKLCHRVPSSSSSSSFILSLWAVWSAQIIHYVFQSTFTREDKVSGFFIAPLNSEAIQNAYIRTRWSSFLLLTSCWKSRGQVLSNMSDNGTAGTEQPQDLVVINSPQCNNK